jgi:hypothetical protein
MSPWYPFKLDWLNQSSLGPGVENAVNDKMKTHLEVLDLLFPKARAEILRLLFSNPKAQRYVRQLMLMSGLALRTVQEELAILAAIGPVMSWSNGYHRFYRANRDHPLFSNLRNIVQTSACLPRPKLPAHRRQRIRS